MSFSSRYSIVLADVPRNVARSDPTFRAKTSIARVFVID